MPEPPQNVRKLESTISLYANEHGTTVRRLQSVVANTIVGQMLPPGIVKGGTAMKMRRGESESRFTPDFDAARAAELSLDEYVDQLEESLARGWGDFTGSLVRLEPRAPEDVHPEYIMQPFEIRLSYSGGTGSKFALSLGRMRSAAQQPAICVSHRTSLHCSMRSGSQSRDPYPFSLRCIRSFRSCTPARM